MAYDLEEQEQIANLKAWWNQYGNLLTWLLTIALAGYAAWNGWNYFQRKQSAEASQLYEEVQNAATAKDASKMQRAAADMQNKFGGTTYAQMTALLAAKTAFDAKDTKTAKAQLQWVIDHGKDEAFLAIAKVRLAGILLDEKAYDEAMKLVSGSFPAEFVAMAADRKGDILVAQNKIAEARAAYQAALDKTTEKSPGRSLTQMKMDAIGGAGSVAAKAAS